MTHPWPFLLISTSQFGTFCTEMNESNKFDFALDVIRYRVSSSCFFGVYGVNEALHF